MAFLFLSVLFSVAVSVLLKLAPRHRVDTAQMVTWNYLIAAILCAWVLAPPLEALRRPEAPWPALLLLGTVLPGGFLVLAASVRQAGIARSDIAQRLSLLVSLAAAFLWFGEAATPWKLGGLVLGLAAIVCLLWRAPREGDTRAGWALPLAVLAVFASVDILLKIVARAGTPFAASLLAAFALAFVLMLAMQGVRIARGRTRLSWRAAGAGALLGLLNFGNIVFYVRAHQTLADSPAVVFAGMNIGVVLLGTLVGALAFGEPLRRINRIAVPMAVVAIALIAWGVRG